MAGRGCSTGEAMSAGARVSCWDTGGLSRTGGASAGVRLGGVAAGGGGSAAGAEATCHTLVGEGSGFSGEMADAGGEGI